MLDFGQFLPRYKNRTVRVKNLRLYRSPRATLSVTRCIANGVLLLVSACTADGDAGKPAAAVAKLVVIESPST